jgi:hypothetical protein
MAVETVAITALVVAVVGALGTFIAKVHLNKCNFFGNCIASDCVKSEEVKLHDHAKKVVKKQEKNDEKIDEILRVIDSYKKSRPPHTTPSSPPTPTSAEFVAEVSSLV